MKQLLWIGCLESEDEFKIKAKKGYDLASAQVSQQNILSGIEQVSGLLFDSINGSVLHPYPVYKDRDIKSVVWEHSGGCLDISVGYRNDKYLNRINCKNAMLKAADNWIEKRYKNGELVVFVYSMRSAPMATACRIKKIIPSAKIYLIVTDLPQFMDLGQSRLKAALKHIDWKNIKMMQKEFDGFILYASKMAEFLGINADKWLLVEGSFNVAEVDIVNDEITSSNSKAIMYSGKLDMEYGINLLLDAFMQIPDDNAELWLTGGGNAEEYIKKCEEKDNRIKFYGFLPTRADVLKKQREATLLVNMRLPSEKASAYCFPSKLFEYMATGVPVLSFKLEGIPEEYYRYLYVIENENSLLDTIESALAAKTDERQKIGKAAKDFILNTKTKEAQARRVVAFTELERINK